MAGGEGDDRGWDGWMAPPTPWTWVWVNSGRGAWSAAVYGVTKSWTRWKQPWDSRWESGSGWIWPKPWGSKKNQVFQFSPVSILLFYLSTHLFIHRCCIPSTHQELLGTVIGSWGKQTSHASWSLDSPSACVWGIELVPCFLMNLRTTFLTSP